MGDPISQDGRAGRISTPLSGDEAVALARFDGNEALSELFEYRCEVVSLADNIDFNNALGQGVTVTIDTADQKQRNFNGLLTEARWAGQRGDLFVYQLTLRPWLHLLTMTSDCRIFTQQSVKDILQTLFSEQGFPYRDDTKGDYPTIEYCVQYRETHFAFVSRMMEKWGIYYYFEHSDGVHTLVAADQLACHHACPDLATVKFISVDEAGGNEAQHIEDWSRGRVAESGKFTLRDYNYNDSTAFMEGDKNGSASYDHSDKERYDAPGGYYNRGEGAHLALVALEAAQSLDDRRTGAGSALSLFPGCLTTLTGQSVASENQEYLVVACSHYFTGESFRSDDQTDAAGYSGSFEFTPSATQFRAEQLTQRPAIPGVQSAVVVGDGEIDVDSLMRVQLNFFWDRKKSNSRRVRVAQQWAGKNYGFAIFPRVGNEVLVQYEDGDPDRPIVTGSVYNDKNGVPATLPDQKTTSRIVSDSSPGHGGFNKILIEDKAGDEILGFRAQKLLDVLVLGDEKRKVGGDQTESIGGDMTQDVGKKQDITVHADRSVTVDMSISESAGTTIDVKANLSITLTVGGSSISITPASISISAPSISLNGMASVAVMAPAVNVTASAAATILGGSAVSVVAPSVLVGAQMMTPKITWAAAFGAPPIPMPA